MEIQTETCDDVLIVLIAGRISSTVAGELCDHLVDQVRLGSGKLLVEIAPGSVVTRAGIRGFVVAASLARAARGDLRIVADPTMEEFLGKVSFQNLLPVHRNRTSALRAVCNLWPDQKPPTHETDTSASAPLSSAPCLVAADA